jgi:Nitroreductase family
MRLTAQWVAGASIYPAVQNIILACRGLGLGTVLTTNHVLLEAEVKSTLDLPEDVRTFGLMLVGYTNDKFGAVKRRPVSEVAFRDRFGTPWPVVARPSPFEGAGSSPPQETNKRPSGIKVSPLQKMSSLMISF